MKTLLLFAVIIWAGISQAQTMFQENLFPADLVMKNREKIGLTDAQAERIKRIHGQNAAEFSHLKWDLDAETEKMKKLLAETRIQAGLVQKQMETILSIEAKLKSKQLLTLVAIKNELSERQQELLSSARGVVLRDSLLVIQPGTGKAVREIRLNRAEFGSTSGAFQISSGSNPAVSRIIVDSNFSPNASKPVYYLQEGTGYIKIDNIDAIDPKEIQSISVLKGSSSEAQFGEAGKNGAIIITLKPFSKE